MKKKPIAAVLFSLVVTSLLATSATIAWFISVYNIARNINTPGEIDGIAVSKYWDSASLNENKWTTFSIADPANLFLGEMTRVDRLPNDHETYFLFRFNETEDTTTHYQLVIDTIDITLYTYSTDEFFTINDVDYYSSDVSQAVFTAYLTTSTNATLNPATLFANKTSPLLVEKWINEEALVLNSTFLNPDTYLYINIIPRLAELQNIIDFIPIAYSPYEMQFSIHFRLEMRTVDEN